MPAVPSSSFPVPTPTTEGPVRSAGWPAGRVPRLCAQALVIVALSLLAACGGDDGPGAQPTPQPPAVTSIAPAAGTTSGGTAITIRGANFATGASVTIGGIAATNVSVQNSATLTAVTGARAAGTGDVVVTVGGRAGTLPNGYTYAIPGPANNPAPRINGLTAQSSRPRAPARVAEVEEEITVTAAVTDAETPAGDLVFEWTSESGTFTGTGASVKWSAPRPAQTPAVNTLKLALIERYVTPDGSVHENRVEQSIAVSVHDSVKEVGDMALLFLDEFSNSTIPAETVVRNFSTKCRGRAFELSDVRDNREEYVINAYTIGAASVRIEYDGVCNTFPGRPRPADACTTVPVRWEVTRRSDGEPGVAQGVDHVTAIYDAGRWHLCDSDFEGRSVTTSALRFKK